MSEFNGTPGEWKLVATERHPFGFKVMAGDVAVVSQDAVAFSSSQRTHADCMNGVGFRSPQREQVVEMLQHQQADMTLLAASKDLLDGIKGLLRIVEAMKLSTGLGKTQLERVEKAKAAIAKATKGLTT